VPALHRGSPRTTPPPLPSVPLVVSRPHRCTAQVLWPHHKLLPIQVAGSHQGLVMLNPGELSGELKDPDDPWGYSHPRCRGLPTCSSSTSSPAVTRHQQEMQRFLDAVKGTAASPRAKRQGLRILNPGELSGDLKDPDGAAAVALAAPLLTNPASPAVL